VLDLMSELSSIIIPVCNRAGLTRQCLESIFDDPPGVPFEIIVVDDGSTDATSEVLASYGRSIRVVRRRASGGFAPACNDGAAEATGDYLVFLNNDTIPQKGWLDVLVDYAESNPRAAVVGSKLLFPDGTVQHAGVIISKEGFPRHIYAGFPADHPAVNLSRRFVAVTFACALVRRREFEEVGGLDADFRNSFEDVDICLRLEDKGHEIHYCHKSVVYHLESVSRGRRNEHDRYNTRLLRERWGKRLKPNDFDYYLADGLLKLNYPGTYPLRWEISPRLALHAGPGSVEEAEKLLDARSREVFTLLKETVRLTAHIAELELDEREPPSPQEPAPSGDGAAEPAPTHQEIFAKVHDIEEEIYGLQRRLEAIVQKEGRKDTVEPFTRSDDLGREQRLKRIRELVTTTVPEEASVLVVSGGDPELLKLNGREARHFPQGEQGSDMLSAPGGGAAAIDHLEELRDRGAEYLVFPVTGLWWLDRYPDFRKHLEERYETLIDEDDACLIFALS
jgi:GT2 family glycosyltransferase